MTEGFRGKIWDACREGRRRFFWRSVAMMVALLTTAGFGLALLFLDDYGMRVGEYPGLLAVFGLLGCLAGFVLALLLRGLLYLGMLRGLTRIEPVSVDGTQQLRKSVRKLEYEDLGERVAGLLEDERLAEMERATGELVAAARYGWFVPGEQLQKILEDENAAALRGKSKDTVVIVLAVPGMSGIVVRDGSAGGFTRKVLAKNQSLARAAGMLLAQFSVEWSVLVADVPFAGSRAVRKRLPGLARKWLEQVRALLAEGGHEGVLPVCLISHDETVYGRIQTANGSTLMLEPESWAGAGQCLREQHPTGIWLSAGFCEHAAIDPVAEGLEVRVPGAWYEMV